MANKKKIALPSNQTLDDTIVSINKPLTTTENNISESQTADSEKLLTIARKIDAFGKTKINSLEDYLDWKKLFDQYEEIYQAIDDFTDEISEIDYLAIKEKIETFLSELNYYNDRFMRKYNIWTAEKGRRLEERADKQQILNFAVFSLFMTLLTFLLSNITVVSKTDYSIKTIVVVNLILLLVASVVFMFIGLFFGLVKKQSKAGFVLKYIVLMLLPFVISTALILVSIFM